MIDFFAVGNKYAVNSSLLASSLLAVYTTVVTLVFA